MDVPVTGVIKLREAHGMVSPSGIPSSFIVLPDQKELTSHGGCSYRRQHDLVTCGHILSFPVGKQNADGK